MKWIKLVPWESCFFKETWTATSGLLDCEFFRRKNEKNLLFQGLVCGRCFCEQMRAPSDWPTCRFLLPRCHLSYNVELEAYVPILRASYSHTCKICAEKGSLIDFISDSDGMDDSWFAAMKEHTPDRHWDFESSRISNTVQWLFPPKKLKFAQFENNSWRRWQQLKEFGWKSCYPLIHPHCAAALCATPGSFEGARDGFRLLAFLCKQIFMLWYVLWHDFWSSEDDADTFFTANILCTVLLEHCSCLSYFGGTLS